MRDTMLDLRHLRALSAIRSGGTLTKAAAALHQTQSALSHLVADLERQSGLRLVERGAPLSFTAAGRRLLAAADAILPLVAATEDDLARLRAGRSGRLLISMECHSCFDWLVPTLDAYRRQWPEVELDLSVGASFAPISALRDGIVDLVITSDHRPAPDLVAEPLFRYEIQAILPPAHRLAERKRLRPEDLAEETLITYPVDPDRLDLITRFLRPAGVDPRRRRTAELTAMIVQLVASGHGIAGLPRWAVANAVSAGTVASRPLGPRGLWSDLRAVWRGEQRATRFIAAFAGIARAQCFRTLTGIQRLGA
jgi:LysR family transcriptional regulator, regulator for metE and metH